MISGIKVTFSGGVKIILKDSILLSNRHKKEQNIAVFFGCLQSTNRPWP